jgi:hypothetical protein
VDELQPSVGSNGCHDAKVKHRTILNRTEVQKWLRKLYDMRAVDEIDDDDSRQLYHDLDSAYSNSRAICETVKVKVLMAKNFTK